MFKCKLCRLLCRLRRRSTRCTLNPVPQAASHLSAFPLRFIASWDADSQRTATTRVQQLVRRLWRLPPAAVNAAMPLACCRSCCSAGAAGAAASGARVTASAPAPLSGGRRRRRSSRSSRRVRGGSPPPASGRERRAHPTAAPRLPLPLPAAALPPEHTDRQPTIARSRFAIWEFIVADDTR